MMRTGSKHSDQTKAMMRINRRSRGGVIHGDARLGQVARLHMTWRKMLSRALTGSDDPRGRYAARGIGVCEEWREYMAFRAWALATGYSDDLTIERIDNDGNYEPNNCRWATMKEQARNRSSTRWVTIGDETKSLAEWRERQRVPSMTYYARLKRGWSVERALGFN